MCRDERSIYEKALITGITGQDGSYLTELLLDKGYDVHGVVRRHSTICTERIDHLLNAPSNKGRLSIHYGDLTDSSGLFNLLAQVMPDEVYNLAAQSHVGVSFEVPEYTAEATGVGTLRFLEAIRQSGLNCRFYQWNPVLLCSVIAAHGLISVHGILLPR